MVRAAAVLALLAALALYYGFSEELPSLAEWENVAFIAFVLMPATFALVRLALPLRTAGSRAIGLTALGLVAVAVGLEQLDFDIAANFVKLAAAAAVGWWFLGFFEALSWVLLIALLIVPVDAYSVARGPTKEIVENQPQIFDALSISFPLPGQHASAQLGLPDVLFFALFLGAAARFSLRVDWTALAMVASFGTTLALAVAFDVSGLPALPLLSVAFVALNADLIWRAYRGRRRFTIRPATEDDLGLLEEMLAWAAGWRANEIDAERPADPALSRYVQGFGRPGDAGVVAEAGAARPVGAAWYRVFSSEEHGFGFVAEDVPELSIAVVPEWRGRGVGTALLRALIEEARDDGHPALSLSVEPDNPAGRLYERAGFRVVESSGEALTMQLELVTSR